MSVVEIIDGLVKSRNGYLLTSDIVNLGISKTYMYQYIKNRNMEKTIAKIISILFQPLFIPIYGVLLLANSPYLFMYNQYGKLFVLGAPVFFC